jgi:hypothetical protein
MISIGLRLTLVVEPTPTPIAPDLGLVPVYVWSKNIYPSRAHVPIHQLPYVPREVWRVPFRWIISNTFPPLTESVAASSTCFAKAFAVDEYVDQLFDCRVLEVIIR